jgi:hypothetical protein
MIGDTLDDALSEDFALNGAAFIYSRLKTAASPLGRKPRNHSLPITLRGDFE